MSGFGAVSVSGRRMSGGGGDNTASASGRSAGTGRSSTGRSSRKYDEEDPFYI